MTDILAATHDHPDVLLPLDPLDDLARDVWIAVTADPEDTAPPWDAADPPVPERFATAVARLLSRGWLPPTRVTVVNPR